MKTVNHRQGPIRGPTGMIAGWVSIVLSALVLASCAEMGSVRTELTTYNDWGSAPAEKTYTFSPPLQFRNSLEMKSYEGLVRDELGRLGFREADPASAKLQVSLRPSLAVYEYNYWRYPDPGFHHRYWRHGWPGYGPYRDPFFHPMDRASPLYQRQLKLEIDQVNPPPTKRLFEASAVNEGFKSSLNDAMPYLVRSIFADFPGGNGQTRNVVVSKTSK